MLQGIQTRKLLGTGIVSPGAQLLRFSYPQLPLTPSLLLAFGAPSIVAAQVCFGLLLAIGWRTRLAAGCSLVIVLGVTLADQSFYQNHYYLVAQLLLCFAVDGEETLGGNEALLLQNLRFVTSLPYVYGALAKVTSADWMLRQQPALRWCAHELPASWQAIWSGFGPLFA